MYFDLILFSDSLFMFSHSIILESSSLIKVCVSPLLCSLLNELMVLDKVESSAYIIKSNFLVDSEKSFIVTTIGEACVCVCAKFDQFLPVRPHFDTKRPVNFFHIATFPSPTFGPLFAFHCPLFFTKNNNLHAAMF